jgi:HrpA-like RNA helicase
MAPPKGRGGRGRGGGGGGGRGRRGHSRRGVESPPLVVLTQPQRKMLAQLLADTAPTMGMQGGSVGTAAASSADSDATVRASAPLQGVLSAATQQQEGLEGREQRQVSEELRLRFEEQQRGAAWQRMQAVRSQLPAFTAAEMLARTVGANDVAVVAGGTGCGKSTQVRAAAAAAAAVARRCTLGCVTRFANTYN